VCDHGAIDQRRQLRAGLIGVLLVHLLITYLGR
jgi:hypothetical protein